MKKIAITLVAILFLGISLQAQTEKKCCSYSFINEYGFYFGGIGYNPTVGLTGVFINGVKLFDQDIIGLGIGYETDDNVTQSIPVFLNYRHIFKSSNALKPIVNFAFGTRLSFWETENIIGYDPIYLSPIYGDPINNHSLGLYSTISAGFNVHAFSLTSGFFFKTVSKNYYAGFEVKVGYTL
jgi:hypothetical protein